MKAIHYQRLLASIFLLLGAWCILCPSSVELLSLRPEFYVGNQTSALLLGCFGAQGMLTGTAIFASRFTARSFLVFGTIASVPFFAFNFYFYFMREMFTPWMLMDFAGNIGILTLSLLGYSASKREEVA